jgi:DNA-directed RNA polymerase subunit N (RpoN/RPB10)
MAAKAQDKNLWEMYFWGCLPFWFECGEFSEKWFEKYKIPEWNTDFVEIKDDQAKVDDLPVQRTECDQMIVCEEGVRWTCIPKHTNIYITSETIPIAEIRKIMDKKAEK